MRYKRFIQRKISDALQDTPIVFLNGPRQSGKSTLLEQLHDQHSDTLSVTLDDLTHLDHALNNPKGFVNRSAKHTMIDEIQRAPELFLPIKQLVDKDRTPGKFLLTGSANILLLPKLADSLAGRMEILTLYPLSVHELKGKKFDLIDALFNFTEEPFSFDEEWLLKHILKGGYPEIQMRESHERQNAWFRSYLTTMIQRDIRDIANIEGLTRIPSLLKLLAVRSGSLLNQNELSRTTQTPTSTLKRYLTLLETVFLISPLPAYMNNLGKRLVKSPKIYLTDTGLVAHLMGLNQQGFAMEPQLFGKLLETFVFTELLKNLTWSSHFASLYHYRTITGQEVDFVIEKDDGKIVGIEVKASHSVSSHDFKGLKHLAESSHKQFVKGYVFYMGDQIIHFDDNLIALPIPS